MSLFDVYPLFDVTPVKAKDVFVYDDKGTEYLDLYGGHAVISIGHSHPAYVKALTNQLQNIGFYSNAVQNPIQTQLADAIRSNYLDAKIMPCLCVVLELKPMKMPLKLASFHTNKATVIAFDNSFHGRTSACVAATDNPKIVAPLNAQQQVRFLPLGDLELVENHS